MFCPGVRAKGGPGFGDAPGDPPPMAPALAGTHADGVRDRAFCVSRHWTFPFAGGELAHRGTCPTLVLYLFKEITPPNQSILTTSFRVEWAAFDTSSIRDFISKAFE